jgi:hypothetical protein
LGRTRKAALVGVAVAALAGCTPVPSSVAEPSAAPIASPSPSPSLSAPGGRLPPGPLPSLSRSSGFTEAYAVNCNGQPGADRVISVLRSKGLISGSATVTAREGPLCAGTWQYTVLSVVGREPLQVVTQGPPSALRLVTAGTEVCSVPVRTQAPLGILTVAHCSQ